MRYNLKRLLIFIMVCILIITSDGYFSVKHADAGEVSNGNSVKELALKQQNKYNSADGKWSTNMYYMDGYVNGVRKLWPMNSELSTSDFWNNGEDGKSIEIILDPQRYMPLDFSYIGVKFKLLVEKSAKAGVTYIKDNFGLIKYDVSGDSFVNLTHSGDINLEVDAIHGFYDSDDTVASFNMDHTDYFKDFEVRFDVLDRDVGIVVGYLKFSTTDKDGNNVNVEGYFAEKYKDNSDRPSINDLYNINNPSSKTASGKSASSKSDSSKSSSSKSKSNKSKSGKSSSSKNKSGKNDTDTVKSGNSNSSSSKSSSSTKVPTLVWVKCTRCDGKGKVMCTMCKGKGYKEYMGYRYGEYGKIIEPCIYCGGAGYKLCTVCGGSGKVMKMKY